MQEGNFICVERWKRLYMEDHDTDYKSNLENDSDHIVTIIIPVYNTEKYLRECLDSIANQSYSALQVILIDDGSTDDSLKVCQEYALKDHRFEVVSKANSGVSASRNIGLKRARGKWICFVDSDDILPENSIKVRVDALVQHSADLSVGNYRFFGNDKKTPENQMCDGYITVDQFKEALFNYDIFSYQGYTVNKLFCRSIIIDNNLTFDEDLYYNEDRLFLLKYIVNTKIIYSFKTDVYLIRMRDDSAMAKYSRVLFDKKMETELTAYERMEEFLDHDTDLLRSIHRLELGCLKNLYYRSAVSGSERKRYLYSKLYKKQKLCLKEIREGKFKLCGSYFKFLLKVHIVRLRMSFKQ